MRYIAIWYCRRNFSYKNLQLLDILLDILLDVCSVTAGVKSWKWWLCAPDSWPFEPKINRLRQTVEDYYGAKFQVILIESFRFIVLAYTPHTYSHKHRLTKWSQYSARISSSCKHKKHNRKWHWKCNNVFIYYLLKIQNETSPARMKSEYAQITHQSISCEIGKIVISTVRFSEHIGFDTPKTQCC